MGVGPGAEIFQRLDFLMASLAEKDLVENNEFGFSVVFISLASSSRSAVRGGGISGGGSSCGAVCGTLFSYSRCRLGLRRIFLESFSWIKPWLVAWS